MQFGTTQENGQPKIIENDRPHFPTLIVGKEAPETLDRLFLNEIHNGNHAHYFGDADKVLAFIPPERASDVVLIESTPTHPMPYNPFWGAKKAKSSEVVESIVEGLKAKSEYDTSTNQLDNNARVAARTLLSIKRPTLFAMEFLFTSKAYRQRVMAELEKKDLYLLSHWKRYDSWKEREQQAFAQSLLNRLTQLNSEPDIRNMIGQEQSFTIRRNSIVIVSLPKSDPYDVIAAFIMGQLSGTVFVNRPPIATGKAIHVVACEYLEELPKALRRRLLANATIVSFRVGGEDEKLLKPKFNLVTGDHALTDIPEGYAYVRLDHASRVTQLSMDPHGYPAHPSVPEKIRARCQSQFANVPRSKVQNRIDQFLKET